MSNKQNWVIDATMGVRGGLFCFCPVENNEIIIGINLLTDKPPGPFIGVFHENGQDDADAFYAEHKDAIDRIVAGDIP